MFIVKIPGINGLNNTSGCEKAPNIILDKLKKIHSNEARKPIDTSLLDLEEIHLDNSNLELTNKLIYKNSLNIFETKSRTIFIGGDHSISFSTVGAFLDYCNKEDKSPCLIVFDAHVDLMKPMQEPTNEEWLRGLIEKGFPVKNILIIGVRNMWREEIKYASEKNISIMAMNSLVENIEEATDIITEFSEGRELYISIDIDVIDPVFAPGTSYPETGGLTARDFLYIISRLNKRKNIRAIDLVEINPLKDMNNLTVNLGAKIIGEFI